MERVILTNNAERFDSVVHHGPEEGRDLEFIVKSGGMQTGKCAVCVSFTVLIKGKIHRVQAVTSLKALMAALPGLEAMDEGNISRN